ncbi:unnamed protein product [Cuscuta epithymum]|uniref:Ubiquitin-like-conjugating enzyme ATG10 n=1 Tax=Cuscuta epithymum TaxID=186058 RepID=A0AAV0DXE5_9ASTE|nr:unnamed protein product [Cuscuta epithymum]
MSSERSIIDKGSWDGSISSREFYIAACAFSEQWQKFNPAFPQWSWCRCPKLLGVPSSGVDGYLCVDGVIPPPGSTVEDNHEYGDGIIKETGCLEEDDIIDSAALVQPQRCERCCYDFHIVYSLSYRVPVLYFRAYWSDGQPLALQELEKNIPESTRQELTVHKWTFITQEEHPYLNQPWFTLHPCGTSEWMKLLFTRDTSTLALGGVAVHRYMVSWFSFIAKVFGLKLPFGMFRSSDSHTQPSS